MLKKNPNRTLARILALAAAAVAWSLPAHAEPAAAEFVWIEGETPTAMNVKPEISGSGKPQFLSGEKWLHLSIDAEKVDKELPEGGALLSYAFTVPKEAKYEIWDRIGFEFVRSPFEWRIDKGDWKNVTPQELTTDLMALAEWTEVAWLKLGEQTLPAGPHTLEIRVGKTTQTEGNDKGKTARILYTSDALLLYAGTFRPNGPHKPGASYRDAKDEAATKQVFRLPEPGGAAQRSAVKLSGLWEVARNDEQAPPADVAQPMHDFPAAAYWRAIPVPSDKNVARPDLVFAHRLWYRTRIDVPVSQAGRSFFLVFPQNNLNTTVYVNGVYCGFFKDPLARFRIDVTKGIKPGQVNEVWVGIRDHYYGYSTNPKDPMKLRRKFNLPLEWTKRGFQDFAYPVWNATQSGILHTPELVAAGPAYASDVFVKPSVAKRALEAEVTVTNPTNAAVSGEVLWQAVDAKTGKVEKTAAPKPFTVAAGGEQVVQVAEGWANPTLWWPNEPHLYRLRTVVRVGGKDVDVSETPFGFREWGVKGAKFTLNGVVWHVWGDLVQGGTKEEWLKNYRRTGQRTQRFSDAGQADNDALWYGLESRQALDFFDANGVVVRRNGPLDGEVIGYNFSESDPDLRALNGGSELKMDLMKNWRDQMVAQVRGERNHPSIHLWTIENEFAYINLINLLGNSPNMDAYEREIQKTADAVMAADPTRLVMIDGGGALKDNTLPVHGDHYVYNGDSRYPDLAYEPYPEGGGRGRWRWDGKRPRYIGEDFFATGINPADYARFGGEAAFLGKAQARPAAGLVYRMLMEGYRWGGHFAAWHFWIGEETAVNQFGSNAWLAAFVREQDWTFGSGQKVKRTFGIFNDTRHAEPVTFTRTLTVGGKTVWNRTSKHTVAPGTSVKFSETIPMPTAAARQEGRLLLTLSRGNKEQFRDAKAVSVLPAVALAPVAKLKRSARRPAPAPAAGRRASSTAAGLLVYDPANSVTGFLQAGGMPFTRLSSLNALPAGGRILLIGRDALDAQQSTSSALAAWALGGRRVIVLEQKHPLKYQAIPAEMEASDASGRIAFGEDMTHPALRGLKQKDLFTWGPGKLLYRNAYNKPTRGGKSLVQCDTRLQNTALAEVPVGSGLLLLSQLTIGENLGTSAVARKLLANLVRYAASYKLEYRPVAAVVPAGSPLARVIDETGLQHAKAADPLAALSNTRTKLALVAATPANLKTLAANLPKVKAFTRAGGYLVLHGLTPEGLADYNKLVGFDHMIRPFKRERVSFPPTKDPLTSGITLSDIVMLSGERIFGWTADEYVASDAFSYVVDYDEVSRFAKSPFFGYDLITNGFVSADGWPLIINWEIPKDPGGGFKPAEVPLSLPKPQHITEFTWIGNTMYWPQKRVNLVFDGKARLSWATQPNNEPQTFEVKPPHPARQVTLQIAEWQEKPDSKPLIGIDDIYLKAKRPAGFYEQVKPMLNIGAMLHYPRGNGGIVLCNLNFKETEAVPINQTKKRTIFTTLLRNLKAPFAGGKTIIAGAGLRYTPIDLSKQANQYRTERGWFGDPAFTFAALPTGRQTFAGVAYHIYDFPTSPVPTAVMLGGSGVPNNLKEEVRGIPVNRKADALFFLHTARIDTRRNEQERRENKRFEMARYVVTYADGQTAEVPVYAEIDVDDYRQKAPAALPGAQIAWTRPYPGTEFTAVAYSKQWNNPRPQVEIKSIDLVYGKDRRGVPVLLAVTAASAQ